MRAVILASGFNVRMTEVTGDRSKAFLDVDGQPLIDRVVAMVPSYIELAVTCNRRWSDEFLEWQKDHHRQMSVLVEPTTVVEHSPGTIGSLHDYLKFYNDGQPLLVLGVDNFLRDGGNLERFIDAFDGNHTLVAFQSETDLSKLSNHGVGLEQAHTSRLIKFVEKPVSDPWPDEPLPRWTSIMCYIFPPDVFPMITNDRLMNRPPAPKMPRAGDFISHLVEDTTRKVHMHCWVRDSWVRLPTADAYRNYIEGGAS